MAATAEPALPELAAVPWRTRASSDSLRAWGRLWTVWTTLSVLPFAAAAVGLFLLEPLSFPVGIACLAHAWIIPELYAQRGANVVRPRGRAAAGPERISLGLLGDLVDHGAREHHAQTGLVPEAGRLGTWLVAEAGALLVRDGGRRVYCYCVKVDHPDLPSGDRIAHLLLALRCDEQGFATVANLAFAGARWRVRRRLRAPMRPALAAGSVATRSSTPA